MGDIAGPWEGFLPGTSPVSSWPSVLARCRRGCPCSAVAVRDAPMTVPLGSAPPPAPRYGAGTGTLGPGVPRVGVGGGHRATGSPVEAAGGEVSPPFHAQRSQHLQSPRMDLCHVPASREKGWYLALMAPNVKGPNYAWLDPSRLYCHPQVPSAPGGWHRGGVGVGCISTGLLGHPALGTHSGLRAPSTSTLPPGLAGLRGRPAAALPGRCHRHGGRHRRHGLHPG